ncbi:DUF1433 domain-containing protein [Staphylococcus ratti]|uniref:DUF1433 domain-containing protein n=1 Tax=Staphylococcus ratti TaxID=2892440 RepID=A0ABY3PCV9_9STAP|nr:DUF1433 domain-containing protein [Staphylococcus ratti]UEX90102.1 DUF1433 domain-containing protein [Staphylococcus ratti]
MSKKHILIFFSIVFVILITIGGIYFKMKYDEREAQKETYYKQQQERITLFLKYNTKVPNTIKSVHFTKLDKTPMGSSVIEGYINNNPKATFTALGKPEKHFQFDGDISLSNPVDERLKPAHELKSPDEIKKELNNKKSRKHCT